MRRYYFHTLVVLFAATLWTGCDKNDNNDDNNQTEDSFKVSGNASGAQERPTPATTNGTGTLTGTYNKESKMLHYTITWTGLTDSVKAMHFHGPAGVDSAAGVQVAIPGTPQPSSGSVTDMATLNAEQEAQLLAGNWYYNLHTKNYPGGEIRGQVTATAD